VSKKINPKLRQILIFEFAYFLKLGIRNSLVFQFPYFLKLGSRKPMIHGFGILVEASPAPKITRIETWKNG
jgi:hypothetical protein